MAATDGYVSSGAGRWFVPRTLVPMRFKTFTWPHNPESYHIAFRRVMAAHTAPFGRSHLQGLGLRHRVMTGQGVFFGADAYDTFRALASLFYDNTPGPLIHPVWQSTSVWLTALSLTQEPQENFVRYSFAFWESTSPYSTKLTQISAPVSTAPAAPPSGSSSQAKAVYHVVRPGDTLWGLSGQYGVTIASILALNPKIKNPNLIYDGDSLRIR